MFVLGSYNFFRYTLAVLSELASKQNITDISDDHIVQWANEKVFFITKVTFKPAIILKACIVIYMLFFKAILLFCHHYQHNNCYCYCYCFSR